MPIEPGSDLDLVGPPSPTRVAAASASPAALIAPRPGDHEASDERIKARGTAVFSLPRQAPGKSMAAPSLDGQNPGGPRRVSIAPPSDIIMDVAQAADPARRQAAVAKLAQAAAKGGASSVDFDAALTTTTPSTGVALDPSLRFSPLSGAGHSQITAGHGSVYQKFEAMILQNFVENILPKDTELFGDAASSEMYRSMMAEKLAEQLAKSGRIGIAKSIEAHQTHLTQTQLPKPTQG